MKLILIISTFIGLLSCQSNASDPKDIGLRVKPVLRGCFELPQYNNDPSSYVNDSILYFLVDIKIINNSKQPIEFLTYSCTTVGSLVVDNKAVAISVNRCSGNGPSIINLKPNQEFSLTIILQAYKKNLPEKIKIGWIQIETDSKLIKTFSDISKVLAKKKDNLIDVIWSESLFLDRTGGIPFEIN